MITELKKDTLATDEFIVVNSSNSVVTGLSNGDFTRDLYNPSGSEVSGSIVPTITELGNGKYRVTFTPNTEGNWVLTIYNATYFPAGKEANYRCLDYRVEDILTDNTGFNGANIDATISSRASEVNATTNTTSIITEVDANETKIDLVKTDTGAIKLQTDLLPADPASETNVNAVAGEVDTELSGTHGSGSWETATTTDVASAVWDAKYANYVAVGSIGRLMKNSGASSFVQRIGQVKGVWTRDEKGLLLKDLKTVIDRLNLIESYMPKVYDSQVIVGKVISKLDENIQMSISNVKSEISDTKAYTKQELEDKQKSYLFELENIQNQLVDMKSYVNTHNKMVQDALTSEFISSKNETNDKIDSIKQDNQMSIEAINSNIDKLNEANELKSKDDELRDKLLIKMVPFEDLEAVMGDEDNEHKEINE